MWTLKKKINFVIYKMFAAWLPTGQRCPAAKKIRYHFAKRVCTLGKDVNIERNAFFTPEVVVGDRSGIGVDGEVYGPVTIGDNVMMGPEVVIYTSGHDFSRKDIPIMDQGSTPAEPVVIGSDAHQAQVAADQPSYEAAMRMAERYGLDIVEVPELKPVGCAAEGKDA